MKLSLLIANIIVYMENSIKSTKKKKKKFLKLINELGKVTGYKVII